MDAHTQQPRNDKAGDTAEPEAYEQDARPDVGLDEYAWVAWDDECTCGCQA